VLSTQHPTRESERLVRNLFAAVDARDPARVGDLATDGVTFRFGSADPIAGKEALVAASREFSAAIAGIHHEITQLWEPEPGTVVTELQVTYRRHDGSELTLPCCNIFRLRDGLIDDYRIYMDITPVMAG
jgi:ketosteroid isomerase-like protein